MRTYIENMPYVKYKGKYHKRAALQKKTLLILALLMIGVAIFNGSANSTNENVSFASERIDVGSQG